VEDEVPDYDFEEITKIINSILEDLEGLISTADDGIIITNGLKVCITGDPNVGKSSIFNGLLGTKRAIITDIPGTTRDYLSENFSLGGYLIRLFDTAGIHNSDNQVEKIGIERTRELVKDADLVLYITTYDIDEPTNDMFLNEIPTDRVIKILNKIDLLEPEEVQEYTKKGYIPCTAVVIDGLDEVRKGLQARFKKVEVEVEEGMITNARQLACVKRSYECLEKAKKAMEEGMGIDFIAFDIQQASNELEEIIGRVSSEDVLNKIFESFCIGK
jgi:tRNA modification GTPase